MKKLDPTMAEQVARAVSVFQEKRTGYPPKAVTVVLSDDTLVVTLHEALSPAEKALSRTPEGAVQLQEYHRATLSGLGGAVAARDQTHNRGRGWRSRRRSGDFDRRHGARLHNRHDGAGVPTRRQNPNGHLERERIKQSIKHYRGFAMLVLPSKRGKTVVVGEPGDFQRLLTIKVLAIKGATVKLGFDVDADVPVHRSEVWKRIIDDGRAKGQPSGPLLPVE